MLKTLGLLLKKNSKILHHQRLNQSQDKDVKVLVYWDNPTLMILDPFHFAQTKYIKRKFAHNERTVLVTIGKED